MKAGKGITHKIGLSHSNFCKLQITWVLFSNLSDRIFASGWVVLLNLCNSLIICTKLKHTFYYYIQNQKLDYVRYHYKSCEINLTWQLLQRCSTCRFALFWWSLPSEPKRSSSSVIHWGSVLTLKTATCEIASTPIHILLCMAFQYHCNIHTIYQALLEQVNQIVSLHSAVWMTCNVMSWQAAWCLFGCIYYCYSL